MKHAIFFIALVSLFTACQPNMLTEGEYFYIENKKAVMPVWVRGNTASNTFLIILSGEPGTLSHIYIGMNSFNELETNYAVVYWDQRFAGVSQGNPEYNTLTPEQFSEDTRLLINTIYTLYDSPQIFLLGHSWGGYLGTQYLVDCQTIDQKISGWIYMDGIHNYPLGYSLSKEWMINRIPQIISQNGETQYWTDMLEWYQSDPLYNRVNSDKHNEAMILANGNYYNESINDYSNLTAELIFFSPDSLLAAILNPAILQSRFNELALNLSDRLNEIKLPVLILWGVHDGNIPIGMAYDALEKMGTAEEDKHLVLFDNSAHVPPVEEPELFVQSVKNFIETYK